MKGLTARQRRLLRDAVRRRAAVDPSEQGGELNIVPFLDVVVNLMLFLLATSAATMSIAQADAELPRHCRDCSNGPAGLDLSVTLLDSGVVVASQHGRLAPGCNDTTRGREVTVPRAGGDYDFESLRACMERIHAAYPRETEITIGADPNVPYDAIIGAMDAVRGAPGAPLFPRVRLSAGVR